ncbi:MAG: Methylated-DNA--protein-cysteine methyltransferase, partial [uncultured Gemmatimonadetes bacterium]
GRSAPPVGHAPPAAAGVLGGAAAGGARRPGGAAGALLGAGEAPPGRHARGAHPRRRAGLGDREAAPRVLRGRPPRLRPPPGPRRHRLPAPRVGRPVRHPLRRNLLVRRRGPPHRCAARLTGRRPGQPPQPHPPHRPLPPRPGWKGRHRRLHGFGSRGHLHQTLAPGARTAVPSAQSL